MAKMSELRKAVEVTEKFQDIPLEQISEKDNVRSEYNGIEELAESIVMSGGLLQPIVVLKIDTDKYQLIAGHRRFRAYQKLRNDNGVSYNTIPAIVKLSIESIPENQLIENIQRENLSDRDIEKAISFILEKDNISQSELSRRIGKDKTWISKHISAKEVVENLEAAGVAPAQLSNLSTNTAAELSTIPTETAIDLINESDVKINRDKIREIKAKLKEVSGNKKKGSKPKDKQDKPGTEQKSPLIDIDIAEELIKELYNTITRRADKLKPKERKKSIKELINLLQDYIK